MGSIPVRVMNKIPDLRIRDFFMQPVRGIEGTRPPAGGKKEPSGLFFSAPGCGSQHPRVPWAARASCWPLPQQLLPASATGRGRRCCKSQRLGMSTVVVAAAFARGIFNLTRTGIAAELTAASGGNRAAVRLHLEYHMPFMDKKPGRGTRSGALLPGFSAFSVNFRPEIVTKLCQ